MAKDVEIVSISSQVSTANTLPVSMSTTNTVANVIGSTADTGLIRSIAGRMQRTQYAYLTTVGSTYIMSTAAVITGIKIIPTSSGAGAFSMSDGTTVMLAIPAASFVPDPRPHFLDFGPEGIRNTAAAGFKITLGASMACLVTGAFGVVTTA
jgi:hypothetical protein